MSVTTFSRYLVDVDEVANNYWIAKMMDREPRHTDLQNTCPICWTHVDKLSFIYVWYACDHWICLDCYDKQCEISRKDWINYCPRCNAKVFYPNDIDRNADIRVIISRKSECFKKRFSQISFTRTPKQESTITVTTTVSDPSILDTDHQVKGIKRERQDDLACRGYNTFTLPEKMRKLEENQTALKNQIDQLELAIAVISGTLKTMETKLDLALYSLSKKHK